MSSDATLTILAILLVAGGCLLVLGAVIVILLLVMKRRKNNKARDLQWQQVVHGTNNPTTPAVPGVEATLIETPPPDDYTPSQNALAVMLIMQSNDPTMPGRRIEITKPITTLGRKSDNDIIFAKDGLVSRRHAVIDQRQGKLYLSEVLTKDDEGNPKRPPFGTLVNGKQINEPVPLQNGDEIQLGKSAILRINSIRKLSAQDDRTMDMLAEEQDKSMDVTGTLR